MSSFQLELPPEIDAKDASLFLAFKLWETGKLSLGQAAKLAGYSNRTFMELLGKHGIPVFNYPSEDLEREANL